MTSWTAIGWTGCIPCPAPASCSASSTSTLHLAASSWWSAPCFWSTCESALGSVSLPKSSLYRYNFEPRCEGVFVCVFFRHQAGWFPFRPEQQNLGGGDRPEAPQQEGERNQDIQEMVGWRMLAGFKFILKTNKVLYIYTVHSAKIRQNGKEIIRSVWIFKDKNTSLLIASEYCSFDLIYLHILKIYRIHRTPSNCSLILCYYIYLLCSEDRVTWVCRLGLSCTLTIKEQN